MATMPRPMTMNMDEMDTTPSAKDKIKSMMLPNGGVDMGMVLQAIEQRYVSSERICSTQEFNKLGSPTNSRSPEWNQQYN